MTQAAFVLSGLAAGIFSGSLGLGGALIATPLIRFLGVTPYLAIGTTVPVLLPTVITGAWTYHRSGLVNMRAVGWTALGGGGGAVAGALATRTTDGHYLMILTAVLLFALGLRMFKEPPKKSDGPTHRPHPGGLFGIGAIAGFFSGLLGIGGGFIMVPVFMRLGLGIKPALGTSLAVISLTAIPNVVTQSAVGNIDWAVAALLAIGVIPGAYLGARLAIRAREKPLRFTVAFAVIGVSVFYAALEITALVA